MNTTRIIDVLKFFGCNLVPTVFRIHGTAFMLGSLDANEKEGHGTLTELHEGKDKREFPFRAQSKVREEGKAKYHKNKTQTH